MNLTQRIATEMNLEARHVGSIIELIDAGNTIPFIARYRKEMTGSIDDQVLRALADRLQALRTLEARRVEVARLVEEQGKTTDAFAEALAHAQTLTEIEDLYRPFRPKRRTRASMARDKGLEPLAMLLMLQDAAMNPETAALPFVDPEKGVADVAEALQGARDILAEQISDDAEIRRNIRDVVLRDGVVTVSAKKEEDSPYRMYYQFQEPVARIAPHRVSAIDRGEREEWLQVKILMPEDRILGGMLRTVLKPGTDGSSPAGKQVTQAAADAWQRLVAPSMENEIRNTLSEMASEQAISVFAKNLGGLLMQPPIRAKAILGLDPAFRTGCKLAVVDGTGAVLYTGVIYPTPPQSRVEESEKVVAALIARHDIEVVAIGNGTASRESEKFVADLLRKLTRRVHYVMVSEAGASVYSASKLAAEEFPEFDVSLRSAVSIARRLLDPLAELVKIDPKAIGVGQYQHDVNAKRLDEALSGVVEDCVNRVGVDLNTASPSLLSHVAGVNATVASNIVAYRQENGRFASRKQLKKVKKLGDKAFEQCAGFLRIPGGEDLLDNTGVHPESYAAVKKLLTLAGLDAKSLNPAALATLPLWARQRGLARTAEEIGVGEPTLADILTELAKPGRDPRDELPKPVLSSEVLEMKDLKPGMMLTGTVRNVADFGAFVDIGVHQDGLVHVSELSDRFVRNPMEVVTVGDVVTVRVLSVDSVRKRISLSMKTPRDNV
jgi:uncharacterized protein